MSCVLRHGAARAVARARFGVCSAADNRCAAQFGIELDDVTTEKQILRKEHHKADEGVGEDEEARRCAPPNAGC
jgi:hypothetical protein